MTSFDGSVIKGSIAYGYDKNSNLASKVTTGFAGASSNMYTYDWADRSQTWTARQPCARSVLWYRGSAGTGLEDY